MKVHSLAFALALASISACTDRPPVDPTTTETDGSTGGESDEPDQSGDKRLFAHTNQTCVVLDGSRLKCWGRNSKGRLGMGVVGAIGDDEHPAVLPGLDFPSAITDVTFAGSHGCSLETNGTVRCWGSNFNGILGYSWSDESVGDDETLLDGPALDLGDGVIAVATGSYFTCVAYADGGVRCWGKSDRGQTGYGSTKTIDPVADNIPLASLPLVDVGAAVKALTAERNTVCAVTQDGRVKCWGDDHYGTLGQGITAPEQPWSIGDDDVPADYPPISLPGAPVRAVSIDLNVACALHEEGAITCWGQESAALGYGSAQDSVGVGYGDDESPVSLGHVDVGGPAKMVEVGYTLACALLEQGDVRCWGTSPWGQLGRGNFEVVGYPDPPAAFSPIDLGGPAVALTVGSKHACALLESGDVRCWGSSGYAATGYPMTDSIGDDEVPASMPPVRIE